MWQKWYWVNAGNAPIARYPVMEFIAPKGLDPSGIVSIYFDEAQCDPSPYQPFIFATDLHAAYEEYDRRHPGEKAGAWGIWLITYPEMSAP